MWKRLFIEMYPHFLILPIFGFDGFDVCFTALQHILGHFGRRQLP